MRDIEDPHRRAEVIRDLLQLRRPVAEAAAAVDLLPWDSEDDLVTLRRADTIRLAEACLRQEISTADCQLWAESLEGRDDVGLEPDREELLKQFLFEMSSPELFEPIDPPMLRRWIATFRAD